MTLTGSDKEILIQHRIRQSPEALENVEFLISNREKRDYDFLFELTLEEIISLYEKSKEFVEVIRKQIL